MHKVSVIVPNYNYLRYLPERINSILRQTFSDYELILLDDCSTDGSGEYLQRLARSCPNVTHCVLNDKNTGSPFFQWDKGVSLASGDYVWIAESDDWCTNDFLATAVAALDVCPTAAYALLGAVWVDENDVPMSKSYDTWSSDNQTLLIKGRDYLRHFLLWENSAYNASGIVFRRSAYEKISKDFVSMRYMGDWRCWSEMALQGDVLEIHRKLNRFRQHNKRVTVKSEHTIRHTEEMAMMARFLLSTNVAGKYREWIAKGTFFKKVKRYKGTVEEKQAVFDIMRRYLHATRSQYYLERVVKSASQIMPFIVTPITDGILWRRRNKDRLIVKY